MSLGILSGKQGTLGSAMANGPGSAIEDGSLGSPMMQGSGYAYQDGALGCSGCGMMKGVGALGETAISVPTTLILGVAMGAGIMYWLMNKDSGRQRT